MLPALEIHSILARPCPKHVTIVMNGKILYNEKNSDVDFAENTPLYLTKAVVGAWIWQDKDNTSGFIQSNAPVTNLNVHNHAIKKDDLIEVTKSGYYDSGDYLPWDVDMWNLTGSVQKLTMQDFGQDEDLTKLYLFSSAFNS